METPVHPLGYGSPFLRTLVSIFGMRSPMLLALLLALRLACTGSMAADSAGVVIATYNVENFIGAEAVAAETGGRRSKPKSEKAIDAVVQIIKDINPDILGICEMGEPERF